MRVRWGTFGSVPTIFGILPNVIKRLGASSRKVSHYWQCAIVVGKVPNLKKNPRPKHRAIAPLHVYYIQFGQYTHSMDSGRPPWAAGEFNILQVCPKSCHIKQILYSLDSKPGGLLSKRGSRQRACPLEIHYTQGAYFLDGAYYPDYF